MRVLIMLDGHPGTMLSLGLARHFPRAGLASPVIELREKMSIREPADLVSITNANFDFIFLPLTLPEGLSLLLAQMVNALDLPVRLMLVSQTEAPAELFKTLFDAFRPDVNDAASVAAQMVELLGQPVQRMANVEDQEAAIESILNAASCFRAGHRGRAPTWASLAAGWRTKAAVLEGKRAALPILFCASDPSDVSRLAIGREHRSIDEQLRRSRVSKYALFTRLAVRPTDFADALHECQPTVLHFAGHGTSTGALCFEADDGTSLLVAASTLCGLLSLVQPTLRCVVFNACYSSTDAQQVAQEVPYVVAMSHEITDCAALAFSTGFYRALAAGREFTFAYLCGRAEVEVEGTSNPEIVLCWAHGELFSGLPSRELVALATDNKRIRATQQTADSPQALPRELR